MVARAEILAEVLGRVLQQVGLHLSPAKCKNFIIQILYQQMGLPQRRVGPTRWHQKKEKIRVTALRAQREGKEGRQELVKSERRLPFEECGSFRLLCLQLDEHWSIGGHIAEVQKKMRARMSILRRLSGLNWGLETRILTITAHALMESVIGCGLTMTGSALRGKDFRRLDARVLNPVARNITGVSPTTGKEVTFALADIQSV